jgi:hypothetical protein
MASISTASLPPGTPHATVPPSRPPAVIGKQVATAEEVPRPPVPRDAVRAVGLLALLPEPEEKEYAAVIPVYATPRD